MTGTNSLRTNKRDKVHEGANMTGSDVVTDAQSPSCGGALPAEPLLFRSVVAGRHWKAAKREMESVHGARLAVGGRH